MYEGDPICLPELWTLGQEHYQMPTAIVRAYTSEGFLIAADGRARDEHGKKLSDSRQKIFPITDSNRALSCVIYGVPRITHPTDETRVIVDLVSEASSAIKSLSNSKASNLRSYTLKFSRLLHKVLLDAGKNNKGIRLYPTMNHYAEEPGTHVISYVFFDGYYKNNPGRVNAVFFHRDQRLHAPNLDRQPLQEGYRIDGSALVADALLRPDFDERLSAYRTPAMEKPKDFTLAEAAEVATNYIRACDSDVGREIDPVVCPGIGGHTHIATITPTDGFKWLIPPLEDHTQSDVSSESIAPSPQQ